MALVIDRVTFVNPNSGRGIEIRRANEGPDTVEIKPDLDTAGEFMVSEGDLRSAVQFVLQNAWIGD